MLNTVANWATIVSAVPVAIALSSSCFGRSPPLSVSPEGFASPLSQRWATQAAASTSPITAPLITSSAGWVPCPPGCGHCGLSTLDASIPRAISESRSPSPPCGRQSIELSSLAVTSHCSYRSHFRSIENSPTMNLRIGEVSPGGTTSGSRRIDQVGRSPWCRTSSSATAALCLARRHASSRHHSASPKYHCAPAGMPSHSMPCASARDSHRA